MNRNGINLPRESVRPAGPTRWEELLREYNLKESEALLILQGKGEKSAKLRQWIVLYRDSVFIPEPVLEAICIKTRWS